MTRSFRYGLTARAACIIGLLSCTMARPAVAQDQDPAPPPLPQVAAGAAPDGAVGGMGDINLYPRRIVMNASDRVTSVGIYNRTTNTGDYEISVADMVMGADGGLYQLGNLPTTVTTDRLQPASSFLRWSPRRVTLLGSESQTVRIMARPPEGLPDGEYRSHFMVVSVPPVSEQGLTIEQATGQTSTGSGDIGVTITPRFGLSIPIIVRVGQTTLDVTLSSPRVTRVAEGTFIEVDVNRSGTRSAYGDLEVTAPGFAGPVAVARGVGVYPEIDSRHVILRLAEGVDPARLVPGLRLAIRFVDDDVTPGQTLAQQDFTVP